ncbi:MAG TPA: hypothetical protein VHD90_14275, partial [Phototrophicaceae bacterium]|nr:hypothetical protein [Phototrophicaceae bacterium]
SVNAEAQALDDIYQRDYLAASVDTSREAGSRTALNAAVKLLGGGTLAETLLLPPGSVITRDVIAQRSPNS